jgi:glycosyltransferase involved in cell wall biosynthesis
MISFVVPAHNEESCLSNTLEAIHGSARSVGVPYEIVVVDDASTDSTATIAREHNATVITVNHRQIAATRNSGAREAKGERLFFVDADTTINPAVVALAMRAMDRGAAGGGAVAKFDGNVPLYAPLLLLWINFFMRIAGMTGGAFMFCTREAFQATGGFDERLYGAEDAAMCWAIKREDPFVVLWRRVLTSGRRTRGMNGLQMIAALFRMAFFPKLLKQRASVGKVWYDSNRTNDDKVVSSLSMRISNAILLLLMIAIVAGPFLNFIPSSLSPPGSVLGELRYAVAILGCHIGLVLWPCAYFLVRILLRQRRWIERIKLTALIVLCLWFAWGGTREVYWFWKGIYDWLTA